jgi:hypothetical protein
LPTSPGKLSDFSLCYLGPKSIPQVFKGDGTSADHDNVEDISKQTTEEVDDSKGDDPHNRDEAGDSSVFEELDDLSLLLSTPPSFSGIF